jgi:hypothetical protein
MFGSRHGRLRQRLSMERVGLVDQQVASEGVWAPGTSTEKQLARGIVSNLSRQQANEVIEDSFRDALTRPRLSHARWRGYTYPTLRHHFSPSFHETDMAPKRKSDVLDLTSDDDYKSAASAASDNETPKAPPPAAKKRKSAAGKAEASSSTAAKTWREIKIDGEDEVRSSCYAVPLPSC